MPPACQGLSVARNSCTYPARYPAQSKPRSTSGATPSRGYEPIAQFENAVTPPAYVVRETSDGRLINDSFGIEWPQYPPYGRYAKDAEGAPSQTSKRRHSKHRRHKKDTTDEEESYVDEQRPKTRSRRRTAISSSSEEGFMLDESNKAEDNDYLFVGAQTMNGVSKLLRPNDFRIYYQMPSSSVNTIPVRIPLCLAYMSAAGKVYHFPIVCTRDDRSGKECWRVLYGDPRPTTFATLSALVKYHKIYSYVDPKTGAIDTFPVWKGTIIDFSDYDST